jgi:hypothetical protein
MVLINLAHPTAGASVAGYRTGHGRVRAGRGGLAGRPAGSAAPSDMWGVLSSAQGEAVSTTVAVDTASLPG